MLNYAEFIELANKVFCKLQANDNSNHIYYAWRRMSGNIEYCCNESQVVSLDDLCDIYWRGEDALTMIDICETWYKAYADTFARGSEYVSTVRDFVRDCLANSSPECLNNLKCYAGTRAYQIALMLSLVDDDTRDRLMADTIGVILVKWFFDACYPDIMRILGEPHCYEILRYNAK